MLSKIREKKLFTEEIVWKREKINEVKA